MIYEVKDNQKPQLAENHLNLGGRNSSEEITVNNRYFVKNGKPWIPVMGEIHFCRLAPECWEDELLKMKAGGITVISTYVIWIYHEEQEGSFNFTGKRDLRRFLSLVEQCGLKAVLRIGPWIHGEVRNGGFPDWLLAKSCERRKNDPEYLTYVKRYFEEIKRQAEGYLFSDDGPVWAIQLENELTDQPEHLLTLRHLAEEVGLCAPVYTVTGWNSKYGAQVPERDVLPVFGGYPEAPWERHTEKLEPNCHYFFLPARNDSSIGKDLIIEEGDDTFHMKYDLYPFATCELGGGMQITHHRRPVMGADDVAAVALVKLGCGNNMPGYYMYHGGINDISNTTLQESKATGYPNDYPIRSYDFQAPLGEFGQVRDAYRRLKLQHCFVNAFMDRLAPMDAYFQKYSIEKRSDKEHLRYSVRTDGESGFVFVNNFQRLDTLAGHEHVQFSVPCRDGMLVFPKDGMKIRSGAYFILPYYLDLGGIMLQYATAQLLYCTGNTWFFFAPFGTEAEFCFGRLNEENSVTLAEPGKETILEIVNADNETLRIVVLTQQEADYFYVLDDEVYISQGAELYKKNGKVHAYRTGNPELTCWKWTGAAFECCEIREKEREVNLKEKEFTPDLSQYQYTSELFLDGRKAVRGYSLDLSPAVLKMYKNGIEDSSEDAVLRIDYDGDVLQIYADGVLAADDFCKGVPYEVSLSYLRQYGTKVELLVSELKPEQIYLEKSVQRKPAVNAITVLPVYKNCR